MFWGVKIITAEQKWFTSHFAREKQMKRAREWKRITTTERQACWRQHYLVLWFFFMTPFFFTRASVSLACIQKSAAVFSHNDLLNLSSLQKTESIYSSVPAIGASDFTILSNGSFIFLGIVVPRLHEAFTSLDRGALLLSRPYCTYYHNYIGLNGSIIA